MGAVRTGTTGKWRTARNAEGHLAIPNINSGGLSWAHPFSIITGDRDKFNSKSERTKYQLVSCTDSSRINDQAVEVILGKLLDTQCCVELTKFTSLSSRSVCDPGGLLGAVYCERV